MIFSYKIKRLIFTGALKVLGLLLFIFSFSPVFAFKLPKGGVKKTVSDSLKNDKSSFKSLFSAAYFDPSKPYAAQLNPQAVPFVENYIRTHGAYLKKMSFWGKPYFDVYDDILSQYKLPKELKYLSVIESALVPGIVSWAGAVGPWQIMAFEARSHGLIINSKTDERTNFYKSTHAAAKILQELHALFNDWTLVIAAYNCGAGRVKWAIRKSGSSNFWNLQPYLPEETRNHVKRFIATHYILEGSGGLTTMTAAELADFNLNATGESLQTTSDTLHFKTVALSGRYKANVIAKKLEIDPQIFNRLNPNFDRALAAGVNYSLKLPADKMLLFESSRHAILNESVQAFLDY